MIECRHLCPVAALAILVILAGPLAGQDAGSGSELIVVRKSIVLTKGAMLHQRIRIVASDVVIDGNGATLVGPAAEGKPKTGWGVGILADDVSHVTLKNIRVRGFETGLRVRNAKHWRIEECDFSGNYDDPEFGWGDGRRVGGMVFDKVSDSVVRQTRARRNWNGLDLRECDRNHVVDNDFSHCSDVCLKLWNSSHNKIRDNNLSYGLRIREGEVHARDSTGVLIESGSNHNEFTGNDVTHGGDGIFIRVLNNWVSTGNTFRSNDCSYANNNGFESWSPGNAYFGNKSNHCSYGFWLGGSDDTVLVRNEASHNGLVTGFHNAPEPDFGHGGIVIVNGSGSHTRIDQNTCIGNNGGGIVFRGDLGTRGAKWKMRHLVVQRNVLQDNKWGLFARFVDGLDLASNEFQGNQQDELLEDIRELHRHGPARRGARLPAIRILGKSRGVVGEEVSIESVGSGAAGGAKLAYRWDVAGRIYTTAHVRHTFARPGLHRISLTANDGQLANLAHLDVYVTRPGEQFATEGGTGSWRVTVDATRRGANAIEVRDDRSTCVVGKRSTRMTVTGYTGAPLRMTVIGKPAIDFTKIERVEFWLKAKNPSNGGFRGPNPTLRLFPESRGQEPEMAWTFRPVYPAGPANPGLPRNLLRDFPYSEARDGWSFYSIPVAGGARWRKQLTHVGGQPPFVSQRLLFTTVQTHVASSTAASLVSTGNRLFCVTDPGGRLFESKDGIEWADLGAYGASLHMSAQWINGMLTFAPSLGDRGSLLLTAPARKDRDAGHGNRQLVIYDLAAKRWWWHPTVTAMTHGATLMGGQLFGLAHAVMGNYGGPLCRIDLAGGKPLDAHSVLGGLAGVNPGWLSRAAQLATLGGKIYGIKNDWQTPQPTDNPGDRLFTFDPAAYRPASFVGGERWAAANWAAASTPCKDLGALPFEVGHGASLVALPAKFGGIVGGAGGLFVVAGCSPSDHEGHGQPSDRWAIYDLATGGFTVGKLPAPTGAGTSACRHGDRLIIKRGGVHDGEGDRQMWIVRTLPAAAAAARRRQRTIAPDATAIDRVDLQFQSAGDGFTLWVDGLHFVRGG